MLHKCPAHIHAKPLHNHEIVYVHFNYFYCTEICDKLRRDLAMFTYIYLNVDEYCLTSSMPQKRFKLQRLLNYAVIPENLIYELNNYMVRSYRVVIVATNIVSRRTNKA